MNCGRAGCLQVDIEVVSATGVDLDPAKLARVTTTYNMPLYFPLSTFMNADFMPVTTTKEEVFEATIVGNILVDE